MYGAMVCCSALDVVTREAFKDVAPELYVKAKPLVKSSGSSFFMTTMIWYGFNIVHDYDGFSEIYSKDLLSMTWWWLNVKTINPAYAQYMRD